MAAFQSPNIVHGIRGSAPGKRAAIAKIIIIPEYKEMKQRALQDMYCNIQSDPFYACNGTKISTKIFLNGDEIGGERCMTAFFVIMRGVNDADLIWPFQGMAILDMFNPETSEFEFVDSFVSDSTSICFQKPNTERNIGYGFLKAIPHEALDKLILNDKLILKFSVITSNLMI